MRTEAQGKALPGYAYWPLAEVARWLAAADPPPGPPPRRCLQDPPPESRTHVAITEDTLTAREGALFTVEGRTFADAPFFARRLGAPHEAASASGEEVAEPARALLCRVEQREGWEPSTAAHLTLGGERRFAEVRASAGQWPVCPPELRRALVGASRLRLLLVTPAPFREGWRPGWLNDEDLAGSPPGITGLVVRLAGAAVGRRQPVSGWDIQQRRGTEPQGTAATWREGGPKAARFMAPAGSVYFLVLENQTRLTDEQVQALWMCCMADDEQDRRDGFGLALPGVW
jgi:CRISPR-associated protein Cmr3